MKVSDTNLRINRVDAGISAKLVETVNEIPDLTIGEILAALNSVERRYINYVRIELAPKRRKK